MAKQSTFKLGPRHDKMLRDLKEKTGYTLTDIVKRGIEAMAERQAKKEREIKP